MIEISYLSLLRKLLALNTLHTQTIRHPSVEERTPGGATGAPSVGEDVEEVRL